MMRNLIRNPDMQQGIQQMMQNQDGIRQMLERIVGRDAMQNIDLAKLMSPERIAQSFDKVSDIWAEAAEEQNAGEQSLDDVVASTPSATMANLGIHTAPPVAPGAPPTVLLGGSHGPSPEVLQLLHHLQQNGPAGANPMAAVFGMPQPSENGANGNPFAALLGGPGGFGANIFADLGPNLFGGANIPTGNGAGEANTQGGAEEHSSPATTVTDAGGEDMPDSNVEDIPAPDAGGEELPTGTHSNIVQKSVEDE